MTRKVQAVLEAATALTTPEQLELLQALADALQQNYLQRLEEKSRSFWVHKSLEELIAEQQVPVVTDISTLVADFWPEDETADDINTFIAEQRRADRSVRTL